MLGVAMIILPLCSSVLASFNRFTFADWMLYPGLRLGHRPAAPAVAGRRP